MIVTHASTTTTLTGSGTEDVLTSPAVQGKFYFYADLNAMAANDIIQFRIYGMGVSGGTSRQMGMKTYYGVQPTDFKMKNIIAEIMGVDCITNVFTTATALSFTATQVAGTGKAIPWHCDREDSLAPVTSGNQLRVTATGAASVDWANVESCTAINVMSGTTIATVCTAYQVVNVPPVRLDGTATICTVYQVMNVPPVRVDSIASGAVLCTAYQVINVPKVTLDGTPTVALSCGTFSVIAEDVMNRSVETGVTVRGALRLNNAAQAGKATGMDTGSVVIRDINDTKARITATTDADGNRSAVTTDLT